MPDETEPEVAQEDPFEGLKREVADFGEYDERALEQYRSFSYYFSLRRRGMARAQAQVKVCETFGHDAPRGLCLRCNLGVDLTVESKRERDRAVRRQEWLTSRH